ncbi:MAG TPA: DUF6429 family protein [Nitrospirota bacterium]|nr:DUF6429 family protein [Nitrospirota bacterium]
MTLVLLYHFTARDKYGCREWRGFDWTTMDSLYGKGYKKPRGKATSIALSEDGAKLSAQLFKEYFVVSTS